MAKLWRTSLRIKNLKKLQVQKRRRRRKFEPWGLCDIMSKFEALKALKRGDKNENS